MDAEVKQRNRRRKRAQRMQAQRGDMSKAADSNEEDESPARREKPPRPPNRRKKTKDPLVEEDIIDGFAILAFKTYEDLETCLKIASKENVRRLTDIERPKVEPKPHTITHHFSVNTPHGLTTMTQDPATSDDSGRASERLTGSSVAPRDADSSRDRLSDASSRCSSGKGYICDSEGDDDKGSDASSVIFGSTPGTRKHEFPGALLPPGLPSLNTAASSSPVPAPTAPDLPAPSPAPSAHLPPPPPVTRHVIIGEDKQRLLLPPPPTIVAATATTSMTVTPGGGSMPSPAPAAIAPPPPPAPLLHCKPPPPPLLPSSAVGAASSIIASSCSSTSSLASASASSSHLPMSMSMPQAAVAAAPVVHHPPGLGPSAQGGGGSATNHARTDSPAVATSAPGYHPPYQPLYAPYAAANVHTPYSAATLPTTTPLPTTAPTSTTVTASAVPSIRSSTPISHSQSMDHHHRDTYSSMVSRSNVTPMSCPPPPPQATNNTTVSSSLSSKPWPGAVGPPPQLSPAAVASRPTPPLHAGPSFATMFAAPMPPPTVVSRASPTVPPPQQQQHQQQQQQQAPPPTNPNPFSAESLFQTSNQADMLRRELDSRFLASQDSRTMNVVGPPPPPYLRTEMHQHQHHHTHVHQHTTSLLPPPPTSTLFPSPLFKDIPKLGSHESPFYRQNIGMPPTYTGYTPSLLHPGLTGPTPFVPPSHLPAFQPKPTTADQPAKPKITKSGKWNAMHVRVVWEIYHHQHKGDKGGPGALKGELLRPPTHLFNPSVRSHEMTPTFGPSLSHHRQQQQQSSLPPPSFDQSPHPGSLFTSPAAHSLGGKPASSFRTSGFHHLPKIESSAGNAMSPFTRYGGAGGPPGFGAGPASSPFSVSPFPPSAAGRPNELPPLLHDPWRRNFPPNMPPAMPPHQWAMKPDPLLEQREREERERLRREREERERREREREEKRRLEQQQAAEQRERERREKERREMEQQRERERLLHQQRLVESAKPMQTVMRDRSPMRNGDMGEIRIKEEPRSKEDEVNNLLRTADPRYHPYLRPGPPHALQRVLPHHYPPPASHWPPPPHDAFYRYDPLRYNPLEVAMRADEERMKMFGTYGHPSHQLRTKDPGLMHLRPGPGPPQQPPTHNSHKMCATPPTDLHKKEEPR